MSTPAPSTAQKWALGVCFGAMGALMLGVVLFDLLVPNGNVSSSSSTVFTATDSKASAAARDTNVTAATTKVSAPTQTTHRQSPQTPELNEARHLVTTPKLQKQDDVTDAVKPNPEVYSPNDTSTTAKVLNPGLRTHGLGRAFFGQRAARGDLRLPSITALPSGKTEPNPAPE